MVRRSLGVALWSLVGLLACFLGALNGLVGTRAGRALLSRIASHAIERAVHGTIEVGDIRGSILSGMTLTEVRLYDPDSSLVAYLPRADLSYNPIDFAAGRVVLFEVELDRPVFNFVQHQNGTLNLEELLRLNEKPSGPPRPAAARPLVLLRNVRIVEGSLTLRLQDRPSAGDELLEIDRFGADGRHRVRRFEHLNARIAAFRISAPRERGIRIDVSRLAVESSDPKVTLTDVAGRLTVTGDTLDVDLTRVRFPASQLSARGRVSWPRDTILFDLALKADSATLTDVRFIDPRFPAGAVLRGGVALRSHGGRMLEIRLDPLEVAYGAGRLSGHVTAFSAADSGIVALRGGDLISTELSLELARPFLDTLPFAGWLTGHTVTDGAMGALHLETDWAFRDSLVPGRPETRIRGRGEVDVAGADLGFKPFEVDAAEVDLGTVRRLVPAFAVVGELDAVGTITGTLHQARFSGTLRHHDQARPASLVRGVIALDSRSDTLGLFADVTTDSLSLDGLKATFPTLPLRGTLAGTIKLDGNLAALVTHADLGRAGAGGGGGGSAERVKLDGVLEVGTPGYGARDFTLQGRDVNLQRWLTSGPPSRLGFMVKGTVAGDSVRPPVGDVTVNLGPSFFAGSVVDTGSARLHFADRRLYVENLRVQQPGLQTRGSGSIGWARPARGTLSLDFDADSLSVLDSLVTWLAGPGAQGPNDQKLAGAARVLLTLDGALDSLAAEARASATNLRWRGWRVPEGRGTLIYQPGPTPRFEVDASMDSVGYGELGFGAASAHAKGTRDSLTWFGRSRVGDLGAFLAGGRFARDGGVRRVGVDSLAVLLPGSVWFLERPVALVVGDSVLKVDTLSLKSAVGQGRLTLEGDLPTRGPVRAGVYLEAFPLSGVYTLLQRDTSGVSGAVTATVALAGTRRDPDYRGSFAVSDASLGAFRVPFLDGTVDYRERRLSGQVHLWREGQQVLNVTAHLPLDLALVPVDQRQLGDTLSVQARADSVDLSVLEAVTPLLRQVRGVFTADLGMGGTWDAPRLRGGLEIAGAGATIPALGVRYDGVNGRLALRGDTIRVEALTARSEKGRAEVTGHVRLDQLTRPVLNLDIAATDFKALDLKGYLAITASGRLALTGPVFGATLTGRGTVTSGVLHFADLVNKRVVNLDEPWVQDLIDTSLIRRQRLGPEFESVFLDSLRIQGLQLTMGSDVWLRSNEANIQLTGAVTVNKVRDSYLMSGTLQAPRGTYRLVVGPVSREFLVNQGTVRYFGTPDLDAELDIEARHIVHPVPSASTRADDKDKTIIAHIRGTLLLPRLTLAAEGEELSQSEIISYLMTGRPSIELTGGQGALVRSTAASLVAGEVERTVVSDLGVPLDYFEFRPGDPTDPLARTQLAAGWQIGDKTFLVLNAGFCQRQQVSVVNTLGASLQYRISPEWRTEASFEPVRNCLAPSAIQQSGTPARQIGFDLFWEKRY